MPENKVTKSGGKDSSPPAKKNASFPAKKDKSYAKGNVFTEKNFELLWTVIKTMSGTSEGEPKIPMREVSKATGVPYTTVAYRWKGIVNHFNKIENKDEDEDEDE